jgi:HAD superfamily hydrolase (TIGR01549 family)
LIEALLIDLDGTFYYSTRYSTALESAMNKTLARLLEVDVRGAEAILNDRKKRLGTMTRSVESLGLDRRIFYQRLARNIEPAKYIRPNRKRAATLAWLKKENLKLALVSNSGRPLVEKVLRALNISMSLFDAVVTSDEAKTKPSPDAFRMALRLLSTVPRRAVYVGDRPIAELKPAKGLGLKTVLVSRTHKTSKWADYIIPNFTNLPTLIDRIN